MKKSIVLAVALVGIIALAGHFWSLEKTTRENLAQELKEEKMRLADALDKLSRASDLTTVHKTDNVKLRDALEEQAAEIADLKKELLTRAAEREQQDTAAGNLEKLLIAARKESEQHKLEAERVVDQAARDRLARTETEGKLNNVQKELTQLQAKYDRLPRGSKPPEDLSNDFSPNAAQRAEAATLKVEVAQTRGELNQLHLQLARDYAALAEMKAELARLAAAGEPQTGEPQTPRGAYETLARELASLINNQEAILTIKDATIQLTLTEAVMFPSGRASLTPEGQRHLETVSATLSGLPRLNILVVGHTDNQTPREKPGRDLPSGWELSAARAGAAAAYLESRGSLNLDRLEAIGRSWSTPVASNDTPEGRRRNNRVELIISEY